jgi:3-keto-5-aminohexanoate cleavage enzyme
MFIVNFCPTGMIPTKSMTPHVPLSPREIVKDIVDSPVPLSMVHIHARDEEGNPTYHKDVYARIISGIRDHDEDLIICVSTSGRNWSEFEKRSGVLELTGDVKPDMASLTLSSLNFNRQVSLNSPKMIQDLARKMLDNGIKPELEVFDTGMLNYAYYILTKGLVCPPLYFNFILGNIACAQAKPLSLGTLLAVLPSDSLWSAGGVGDHQLRANILGLASGGGVRVGLEDNIWMTPERKTLATNHSLLCRITAIAGAMGLSATPPGELRKVLRI